MILFRHVQNVSILSGVLRLERKRSLYWLSILVHTFGLSTFDFLSQHTSLFIYKINGANVYIVNIRHYEKWRIEL